MTSAPAIGFEYRPSRLLQRLPAAAAALALLATGASGLAWWLKALVMAAVVVAAAMAWRAAGRSPVRAAGWRGEGDWSLRLSDGGDVVARLAGCRTYGETVLLRLAVPGRRPWTLLLAPDNLDADTRRRLRMRLTAGQGEAPAGAGLLPAGRRAS